MNYLQKAICRVSIGALFGSANKAYDKGKFQESFSLCMDGVSRSRKNEDEFTWDIFFQLAVKSALKLNKVRYFDDLLSDIEEHGTYPLKTGLSGSLLKLSMLGFSLGKIDESIKVAKCSIDADASNADAFFFCGWLLLEPDIDLAEGYLRKSGELDRLIEQRIKQDKKCQKFVRSDFYSTK